MCGWTTTGGGTINTNVAVTVQLFAIVPVVNVVPLRLPPHPAADAIRYPSAGVRVKAVVPPLATVWAVEGAIVPPVPAVGVTIRLWLVLMPVSCGRIPVFVVPSPSCPYPFFPHIMILPSAPTAIV